MMVTVAVVKDGKVVNIEVFSNADDIEGFDFAQVHGEGAFGVALPDGSPVGAGYTYDDGAFKAPPLPVPDKAELIGIAEAERQNLLKNANQIFMNWQTKLLLNRATEEEKASLNEWVDYFDALQQLNVTTAPDIDWPEQPPVPETAQ